MHPRHLIQRGRVLVLLFCATLSGCVTVPVVAKTSTGEKFLGSATASLTSGTFELTSVDGLRCWGTYDQWDPSTTLRVDFKASDGRYGTALIARDSTGTSGIGTGAKDLRRDIETETLLRMEDQRDLADQQKEILSRLSDLERQLQQVQLSVSSIELDAANAKDPRWQRR